MDFNNEEIYTKIGQNIRKKRVEKKISQASLARKIKIKNRQSMSSYEIGKTQLNLSLFIKICNELNCSADELIGDQLKAIRTNKDCPFYKQLSDINRNHIDAISAALYMSQDKSLNEYFTKKPLNSKHK